MLKQHCSEDYSSSHLAPQIWSSALLPWTIVALLLCKDVKGKEASGHFFAYKYSSCNYWERIAEKQFLISMLQRFQSSDMQDL